MASVEPNPEGAGRSPQSTEEKERKSVSLSEGVALKCQGCGKAAPKGVKFLSCPKCVELRIHPNEFCSQQCFASSWSEHKSIHQVMRLLREQQAARAGRGLSPEKYDPNDREAWLRDPVLKEFLHFKFTGSLRPWPRSPRRKAPEGVALPDYALTGVPLSERKLKGNASIRVLSEEEAERVRSACRLGRAALDLAHQMIKPGVRAEAVDDAVFNFVVSNGGYPSPLNYEGFPKACCISVNEVICHGIPDSRPFEEGDIVNVDITVFINGMHGDLNETFFVGTVSEEKKKLVQGAYFCLMEAIKHCKPGVMYREIGQVVSAVADKFGLSVVRSYCGHGIGELFHAAPSVPHYRNNKAVGTIKPGHVFTIEPMLNLGKGADVLWPDGWTAVSRDGSPSAQFEHTLLATDTGIEILTKRTESSPKLGIDTKSYDFP